jgi:hypothetical protein
LGLFCNFTISAKLFVVADDGCSRFVWMRRCIVIEFIALDISSLLQIQSKCDRVCVHGVMPASRCGSGVNNLGPEVTGA